MVRYNNDDHGELTVSAWNVRSLQKDGKLENAINEMERHNWDILGISEARYKGCGDIPTQNDTHLYFSGGRTHEHGVALLVTKAIHDCITGYVPQSDRVMLVQLNTRPIQTNLIQVYAPTEDSTDAECEKFYDDVTSVLKLVKRHEVNIIMGDLNSKVGDQRVQNIVGPFGLGVRNDRGDMLIDFCIKHNLTIMNTWFKLPKRRLYTWQSGTHKPDKCEESN